MPAPTGKPALPELAAELARSGVSNVELAYRVRCSVGYITHIRRGRMSPSADMRRRIAEALGRPDDVDVLFQLSDHYRRLLEAARAAVDEAPPLPDEVVRALVSAKGGSDDVV